MNSVVISNQGTGTANNINFNMGLGSFYDNGLTFSTLTVTQVSGPAVTVNTAYDGDTNTTLLDPNNTLAPGETIVLEIFHLLDPISNSGNNSFNQLGISQTQGGLDGLDEDTAANRRLYSFVTWEDNLGNHLDRYYSVSSATEEPVNDQCECQTSSMSFTFTSSSAADKVISNINEAPNGILEHQEITFLLTVTNTSNIVELDNLQIQESFAGFCGSNIVSFNPPTILASTATTNPVLNPSFNGITDINIFNGTSGLLMANESITIELTIVVNEDCFGVNTINFSGTDPLGNVAASSADEDLNFFTDTDNDGISNVNDIDDDNDTILDLEEYDGIDPIGDDDADLIPNYRDTDYGPDTNNDGIVDRFDFDADGVPNHFDLDSDNDGIFDIAEINNTDLDTNNNGRTNNAVGLNDLDDTQETNDTFSASVLYTIPNTDGDPNPNYKDIDSDADGIVDNIEAQATDAYIPPNNIVSIDGVDTAYLNGLSPVDTEGDTISDYLDTNSDDDVRNDVIEGWDFNNNGIAETTPANLDADNDGLDDAFDNDDTTVNPTNGQVPTSFPNVDYDVTTELDWREIMAVVVIIDDVSVIEGTDLQFTVSLVTYNDNTIPVQSTTPVVFTLATVDGTDTTDVYDVAIAPFDYIPVTNISLAIPAFTETLSFTTISSLDDNIFELDELFTLNGEITSGNTINTEALGIGTILDNDAAPDIIMNDTVENEGVDLVHTITLSNPCSTPIIIDINTTDNTAISPEDYQSVTTTFTIDGTIDPDNPNIAASFNIATFLDNLNEPDQELLNVLGNVTTGNVGNQDLTKTGTILDIDPDPLVVITDATVVEGMVLEFEISLLNSDGELMRNYLPINFGLQTLDITTTVSQDYPFLSINASIPALQSTFLQAIPTIDDRLNEETETMNLEVLLPLTGVSNTSSVISGLGTIKDNDIPNLFSPNNDGISEVFRIDGIEDFPNFKLVIIDRWGSEIYNYSNNGNPNPLWWDGTNKGKPVVEGVYFYTLEAYSIT